MILQDVLSTSQDQFFNLHQIDIASALTISVHFEIQPLNPNISYLFIYKFDGIPQWNSKIKAIDGWTVRWIKSWTINQSLSNTMFFHTCLINVPFQNSFSFIALLSMTCLSVLSNLLFIHIKFN